MQKFEIDSATRGFESHANVTLPNAIVVKIYDRQLYKVIKEFAEKTKPHDWYPQQPAGEAVEYTVYYLEYSFDATQLLQQLREELGNAVDVGTDAPAEKGKPDDIVDDTETTTNRT